MKIAIITGASSGMGRELAMKVSKAYKWLDEIWIIGRRRERLEELRKKSAVKMRVLPLDLTNEIDLIDLKALLKDQKPKIKLLGNAAGYGKIGGFEEICLEDNLGMIDLNNRALTAITHMCLPYMRGGSRILQFASAASFLPQPGFAVYAASKSYVLSFSRALRCELKERDITVTCVCPGPVDTEFFEVAEEKAHMPAYKKYTMVTKEDVVTKALLDAVAGKEVSVYGVPMNGMRVLTKMIPHKWILSKSELFAPKDI